MNTRRHCLAVATFLLALSGCATSYQSRGPTGGYSDLRLDASTFRVSFRGNGYTPRRTVEAYAFYRCAELTLQAGYDNFVVVGGDTDVRSFYFSTPGHFHSTTDSAGNTRGTYSPGATVPIRKFEATIIFKAFNGPKSSEAAFDAREVLTYLGPEVKR